MIPASVYSSQPTGQARNPKVYRNLAAGQKLIPEYCATHPISAPGRRALEGGEDVIFFLQK